MSIRQEMRSRCALLFQKSQMQRELGEDLEGYEQLPAEEKIARGVAPEQARREARLEMGSRELVKENVHDA